MDSVSLLQIPHAYCAILVTHHSPFTWSQTKGQKENKYTIQCLFVFFTLKTFKNSFFLFFVSDFVSRFPRLSPSGRTLPLVAWHAELWKVLQSPDGIFHIHTLPSSVPASSTGAQGCHSNHWGGSRADGHQSTAALPRSSFPSDSPLQFCAGGQRADLMTIGGCVPRKRATQQVAVERGENVFILQLPPQDHKFSA